MKPETLTIIIKGVGMALAFIGGIAIARYGFRLYKDGAGMKRDLAVFEFRSFKLKAHSVGSIVMATAFLWAWAGVALSPNLEKENGRIHVYSFQSPQYKVEAEPVVSTVYASNRLVESDPQQAKRIFRDAINRESFGQKRLLRLNNQPARFDLSSIGVKQTEHGGYLVTAKVKSGSAWASLAFEPTNLCGQLAFVPKGVPDFSISSDPNHPVKPDLGTN